MEAICLDTDFLISFLRNKKEAVEFVRSKEHDNELATTIINLFELYYGAYKSGRKENVEAVAALHGRITILGMSEEMARTAGKQAAKLELEGAPLEFRDVLIGIIALSNRYHFKTGNKKHFCRISGLLVE